MLFADEPLPPGAVAYKDLIGWVIGILAFGVPALGGVLTWMYKLGSRGIRELREENRLLKEENAELKEAGPPDAAVVVELKGQLQKAQGELAEVSGRSAKLSTQIEQKHIHIAKMQKAGNDLLKLRDNLRAELKKVHDSQQERERAREAERRTMLAQIEQVKQGQSDELKRIQRAVQKNGITWTEKVMANAPEFKPLKDGGRKTPIVSLLNLKGGVGKTTTTANLGTAFARMGWRVLLVDLDLQGSLTSLFLPTGEQKRLRDGGHLIGNFLERAFEGEPPAPDLTDFIQFVPVDGEGKCGIVATTDTLAYAEINLTVRWFLRDERRDPRFLLRRELHLRRITKEYDIVLIDCPPVMNVSCVNALAASDFVLIPVMPSRQATDRVTVLLDRLKEFHDNLNTDLKVMGFFANRTHPSGVTSAETNLLSLLADSCKSKWSAAPQLKTVIRQSPEVRDSEEEGRPLNDDDALSKSFRQLAEEVIGHLPAFCRAEVAAMEGTK